ncbi:MAG: hypothetical protein LBM09_00960 [Candidatus Nomurabacteria bacterium]|jgi:hypothetical protein|nr:hypothetical protein [Candidatus Nomurabacteria bacterium]
MTEMISDENPNEIQNSESQEEDWSDFDFSTVDLSKNSPIKMPLKQEISRVILLGIISGASAWLLRLAFENWVMNPLFCRTADTVSVCANSKLISFVISLVVVGIIVAAISVAVRVHRGIVVSLATFASFGALFTILSNQNILGAILLSSGFTVALFLIFLMINAIKKTALSFILTVVFAGAFWLVSLI